jgi:hypothetical protein
MIEVLTVNGVLPCWAAAASYTRAFDTSVLGSPSDSHLIRSPKRAPRSPYDGIDRATHRIPQRRGISQPQSIGNRSGSGDGRCASGFFRPLCGPVFCDGPFGPEGRSERFPHRHSARAEVPVLPALKSSIRLLSADRDAKYKPLQDRNFQTFRPIPQLWASLYDSCNLTKSQLYFAVSVSLTLTPIP